MRSLPPSFISKPTWEFTLTKPIPFLESKIAPWFYYPGGGIQYRYLDNFSDDFIKVLFRKGIIR